MQSNIDCLMEDHELPDSWVELHNVGDGYCNIGGWRIGETPNFEDAWTFANNSGLSSGCFYLIYCDKESLDNHTDFRLDSGKGALYLFDASGNIVDSLHYAGMPAANVAYGRISDNSEDWQFECVATPGSSNSGKIASEVAPDPVFSVPGGIYTEKISLNVSMPEEGCPSDAEIYYSLDGSEPTMSSPHASKLHFEIKSSTVVRAKILSSELLPTRAVTQSYLFHPRELRMPIVSLATDSLFLYGEEYGILYGSSKDKNANYWKDWRRPVNIEYFTAEEDSSVFNQLGEIRNHGAATRIYGQKSLNVYTGKRFGKKKFKYPFWSDKEDSVTSVKSFTLHNGGNDCSQTNFTDGFAQSLFGHHVSNLDWMAYQPVICYINGVYYGQMGLRERDNEDYIDANYNGLEDVIFNKHWYGNDVPEFNQFRDLYNREDVTYEELSAVMDIDNFRKMFMVEVFVANTDFPNNNMCMWKPNMEDGKWRWFIKDLDYMIVNNPDYNYFNYILRIGDFEDRYNNLPYSCKLFQVLIFKEEFRESFIDQFIVWLGDFLKPKVTTEYYEQIADWIYPEILPTSQRCNLGITEKKWNEKLEKRLDFLTRRPGILYQQMSEMFDLGEYIPVYLATDSLAVEINGFKLTEGDFDGAFYLNRSVNICLSDSTWGWQLSLLKSNGQTQNVEINKASANILLSDYSDCISAYIKPAKYEQSSIEIPTSELQKETSFFDLFGRKISSYQKNAVIIGNNCRYMFVP